MPLESHLFRGDPKLDAAAASNVAHILPGSCGPHVTKIQQALIQLDGAQIGASELDRSFYGSSTASAVLVYKQKRNIVNRSYQTQADNIVGRMTMASLDAEIVKREQPHPSVHDGFYCGNDLARRRYKFQGPARTVGLFIGSTVQAVAAGGAVDSPKEAAFKRLGDATMWVTAALGTLNKVRFFRPNPIFPTPITEIEIVAKHWHVGRDTPIKLLGMSRQISNGSDYLDDLITTCETILRNLANAQTIFFDSTGDLPGSPFATADAFTIGPPGTRAKWEEPFATGIHFRPKYLSLGVLKQQEVIVHESAHFINNSRIQDIAHAIKEREKYAALDASAAINNAYSYSQFFVHCGLKIDRRLKSDE